MVCLLPYPDRCRRRLLEVPVRRARQRTVPTGCPVAHPNAREHRPRQAGFRLSGGRTMSASLFLKLAKQPITVGFMQR
jgi:hypothetical protein